MTLLLFLLAGLVLGVVAERVVGPPRAVQDAAAAPAGTNPYRRRVRTRRIVGYTALALVVLLVAGAVGGYLWASSVFDKIEKVDVSAQLTHGSGTNYLLVGSDGVGADGEKRDGVDGRRSDTIMVLRVEGGTAKMLSLNRDLWVDNPGTGQQGRLNATYNTGPANLVQAVTQNFGIPIDRYIEVDFNSFGSLVDEFGGIDIAFANPAFDLASGLDIKQAGVNHLDGTQALAYVRSRHYYEMIDGQPKAEGGLPDVNRTVRQQTFLREIMKKAGSKRNPLDLMQAADSMSAGLRIDDDMTMLDAARFAWNMGKLDPVPLALTVIPVQRGAAAVLEVDPGPSEPVLAQFR